MYPSRPLFKVLISGVISSCVMRNNNLIVNVGKNNQLFPVKISDTSF